MLDAFRFRSRMNDPRVRFVWQFRAKMQHCEITCRTCRRRVILPPDQAIATFGALAELTALEKRLVCSACGGKGAGVSGVYREYHG